MNHRRVTALFALTLFTSASLIFIVEPMFGKILLGALITGVEAPLFVLSATAPLLQKGLSVNTRWASDPCFLYATRSLGSILALGGDGSLRGAPWDGRDRQAMVPAAAGTWNPYLERRLLGYPERASAIVAVTHPCACIRASSWSPSPS